MPEYREAAKGVSLTAKQRHIVVRELLLLARPQGQPENLGNPPLTVLSAGNAKRRQWADWATWCELQDEFAALSSRSAHMYAVNADHFKPGCPVNARRPTIHTTKTTNHYTARTLTGTRN